MEKKEKLIAIWLNLCEAEIEAQKPDIDNISYE